MVQRNEQVFINRFRNVNQKVACMLVGNKVDMSSKRAVSF
jgi:phage-related minor tail protein